jgi:hypothetical protein
MAIQSYFNSIRAESRERQRSLMEVIDALRGIVRAHARFDGTGLDASMELPAMHWDPDSPEESVWFDVYGPDGNPISKEAAGATDDVADAVDSAEFIVSEGRERPRTIMTIETSPPNMRGHDGAPLSSVAINAALIDLHRYEVALSNMQR